MPIPSDENPRLPPGWKQEVGGNFTGAVKMPGATSTVTVSHHNPFLRAKIVEVAVAMMEVQYEHSLRERFNALAVQYAELEEKYRQLAEKEEK